MIKSLQILFSRHGMDQEDDSSLVSQSMERSGIGILHVSMSFNISLKVKRVEKGEERGKFPVTDNNGLWRAVSGFNPDLMGQICRRRSPSFLIMEKIAGKGLILGLNRVNFIEGLSWRGEHLSEMHLYKVTQKNVRVVMSQKTQK